MKTLLLIASLLLAVNLAFSQVGINNSSPDSSAVLDLKSNSNNQGLLVPRLSSAQIAAISNPATGLLAYNTDWSLFCYYDGSNWYSLRTFRQILNWGDLEPPQDMDADIYDGKNVGIGYSGANSKISVNGNLSIGANEEAPANGAFIAGQVRIGSNEGFKKLEVDGEIHSTNHINTGGKIQEGGHDLLPAGSIIMWSGSNPPAGWKLCNGTNGTPDLRGRFIMGYGDTDEVTLNIDGSSSTTVVNPSPLIGSTGGYDKVAISENQMPAHNHTASVADHHHTYHDYYRNTSEGVAADPSNQDVSSDNGLGNAGGDTGDAHLNITIGHKGGNAAHENRPPYYVLAFIMKE